MAEHSSIPPIEVWAALPFYSLGEIRALAPLLEEVGVDGVALADHVCVPSGIKSAYPFGAGPIDIPAETSFLDPLIAATVVGEHSRRLRIMTWILLAPLRDPILLAREVAAVSIATGGRFELGVGVGWLEEEYRALGIDFDSRGERLDEMLDVMAQIWSRDNIRHAGRHFTFGPVSVNPKPMAPVPVLIGGHSLSALRRAARHSGWLGGPVGIGSVRADLEKLESVRDHGAGVGSLVKRTGCKGALTPHVIRSLADLGVDAIVVSPWQVAKGASSIYDVPVDAFVSGIAQLIQDIRRGY